MDQPLKQATTEVFVVGGGPAGLAVAIAARQVGLQATVADGASPPIDKSCGEGLLPEGVQALRALGIELGADDAFPIRGIRFSNGRRSVAADFPLARALGIRRTTLHARMVERAEACGVRLFWKSPVRSICSEGVRHGQTMTRARWIIGADGSSSRVRAWAGLDAGRAVSERFGFRKHYRVTPWSEHIEVYWTSLGQIYVTPVSHDEISVAGICRQAPWRVDDLLLAAPDLGARLAGAELTSAERGAVTALRRLPRVYRENVALIGDASGSTDAITGLGLCLAFEQAHALATALAADNLELYAQEHRLLANKAWIMGRLLLLMDRYRLVRNRAFAAFAHEPRIFERLLAAHSRPLTRTIFTSAGMSLGWHLLTA